MTRTGSTIRLLVFSVIVLWSGCQRREANTLFVKLSPQHSGIRFENKIDESEEVNIMTYEYLYNGGGVAAGDFNNDGWCDLYFSGNTVRNRLYLNNGDLTFKDVTEPSGVAGRALWKTGVTAADVNGDGWLDLYVCYSGPDSSRSLSNQLLINNGTDKRGQLSFTDRAKEYGLDAPGTWSTQASFFDYDKDGDLDMFLLNHGNHFYSPFVNTHALRNTRHPHFGNRLYRNELMIAPGSQQAPGNYFTEVSQQAGIRGGGINFGLGISVSDVNEDGWPDIFVTNDYEEQDFLYLNNGNGTFRDCTKKAFAHLSRNGMGTDIADFNNDARPDLMEVDMWPEDNFRQKLLKGPDDYNRYTLMVDSGFHHQQMRNTLQVNTGVARDSIPLFCEMGQLAGVSATDWSWSPLFADLDNDGLKDLFITNGYLRDFTSMDFLKYTVEDARKRSQQQGVPLRLYELVKQMPSTRTSDYVFRNAGNLTFTNQGKTWGMATPDLSFGATYADLDNDGDLELITNNTNEVSTVWLNQSDTQTGNHYLRIRLTGPGHNSLGIGAKISVGTGDTVQLVEQYLTRGFQSSVDPVAHFGLGKNKTVTWVDVVWPDGKVTRQTALPADRQIEMKYSEARDATQLNNQKTPKLFRDVSDKDHIDFVHRENTFIDFDHEPLIPYQLSRLGPALASGDVNGDGADDFYIGGAIGQAGALYLANGSHDFSFASDQPWKIHADREDTGATFFDADGDGDLDLFVVSGGNEYPVGSTQLDDRLYLNNGKGKFAIAPDGSTIADHASGSCVTAGDYDRDGDVDLFVGGRSLPGQFPITTPGAILRNDTDRTTHQVRFTVATAGVNPELRQPGMVTDALWTDYNNDQWPDLLIVGEWMPIRLFENQRGKLTEVQSASFKNTDGLWNRIHAFDADRDGDLDYVLGNAGSNLPWHISAGEPLTLYASDFNNDGRVDPLICYTSGGKSYPVASRDELLLQVNSLRKKFITYASYANATAEAVFPKAMLEASSKLYVRTVQSSLLENLGNGNFRLSPLPLPAQISSVRGIVTDDFTKDGLEDILLAGNFYPYRTQYGRSDASQGLLLIGDGQGNFQPVFRDKSGLLLDGDIRNIVYLNARDGKYILAARNNDTTSLIEVLNFSKKHL